MRPHLQKQIKALVSRAIERWEQWWQHAPRLHKWLPQCIAAAFASLIGGGIVWLLPYQTAISDLHYLQQQEATSKQAYLRQLQHTPQIDLMRARELEAKQYLTLLEQQLTNSGEQEAVMNEIDTAGLARGLHFTLFKPETEQDIHQHRRTAVQLRAVGSYQAIARFANDIAQLPRIVILSPVTLQTLAGKDEAGGALLALEATATAFQSEQKPLNNETPGHSQSDNHDDDQY